MVDRSTTRASTARRIASRYGLAVLAAILALFVRLPLWTVIGSTRSYLTFYPAIILSGWYCGFGPGIATSFLSAIFLLYGMDPGEMLTPANGFTAAMFVVTGAMAAAMANSLRTTRERSMEAQEKLRVSEERSKYILESIDEGFLALDGNLIIRDANSAAEKALRTARAELAGKLLWDVFPGQKGTAAEENYRRTLEQKEAARFEHPESEGNRWFDIASYPSTEGGLSIFFRDITGRKLATEALRLSEERFRVALKESPITVFNLDRNLQTTWIYNAQAPLADASSEAVAVENAFPNGLGSLIAEAARESLRSEAGSRFCHSIRTDSGLRACEVILEPLRDRDLLVTGITGAVMDVTASKQVEEALSISEERLRMANEAGRMGVWNYDRMTAKVGWSEELERIFGLGPGEFEGTLEAFESTVHPDDLESIKESLAVATLRLSDFEIEFRFRRADGECRWLLTRGRVYADGAGGACRIAGVGMDVTDRRKLEEKVRHAAKLESLGVLAGGIAHDFNNLLTGILGNATLLRQVAPAQASSPLLHNVIRAAERAAQLSRQMLAYSGRGHFSVRPVDLSRQFREFVSFVETTIPKNVVIRLNTSQLPTIVDADEGQLQQVIMNLVVNAAEAIGGRDGRVEVTICKESTSVPLVSELLPSQELPPGEYIVLQVSDNGCGMTDAVKAKIFDPFFTTKFTGRGLGLAAVLGIVRGHRGTIRVQSQPGIGTCFQVYFPPSRKSPEPVITPLADDIQGAGTVLVVDDEDIVRVAARTVLENFGYTVVEAANGKEALRVFERHATEITVVLLDMTMPVMSGVETLRKLRHLDPDVAAIASSGYNESEALQLFGSSIAGFIQKPYTATDLGRKIKAATRGTSKVAPA
jgi:PAS domain S-box-containing protein